MTEFLQGAITVGFAAAGLFFLRFWRETMDRLFLFFAISFWLQGIVRIALTLVGEPEDRVYLYLLRLAAFVLILVAIAMKNLAAPSRKSANRS